MFKKQELKKIKKETEEFFKKMSFEVEVSLSFQEETLKIDLRSEDPRVLIGEKGKILVDLQRILRTILNRKLDQTFFIDLDINDYKKKKIRYLKELAREAADDVILTKKEKVLPPMSAYERRIVHLELADRRNVTTQSIGEEPERRVVIRPYP